MSPSPSFRFVPLFFACILGMTPLHAEQNEAQRTTKDYPPKEKIAATNFTDRGRNFLQLTFNLNGIQGDNFPNAIGGAVDKSKNLNYEVELQWGYFIRRNMALGVGFGYGRNTSDAYTYGTSIILPDTTRVRGVTNGYTLYPNLRNYIPVNKRKTVWVFNQTNLSLTFSEGTSLSERYRRGGITKNYDNTIRSLKTTIGIQPGIMVFIGKGATLEGSIRLLGLTSERSWYKYDKSGKETEGKKLTNTVNFNINVLTLNLGITFYI